MQDAPKGPRRPAEFLGDAETQLDIERLQPAPYESIRAGVALADDSLGAEGFADYASPSALVDVTSLAHEAAKRADPRANETSTKTVARPAEKVVTTAVVTTAAGRASPAPTKVSPKSPRVARPTQKLPAAVAAAITDADADDVEALPPGAALGRYVVLRKLGAGGVGVVYLAYDPELDRKVAIKLINARTRSKHSQSDARGRLVREARAMAQLNHANVITIHDVGTLGERVFLAMEFIEGATLSAWFRKTPRPWRDIVRVFSAAAHGLQAVHDAGFIHRDFKPDNVMISSAGEVRVMDFGLVRGVGDEPERRTPSREGIPVGESRIMSEAPSQLSSDSITRTGLTMGTPAYMSPEQHAALPLDPRSDQFSFCVALYEALYGARPFQGNTLPELATAVISGRVATPPRALARRVPRWLRRAVRRGLSVNKEERFPSMNALVDTLRGRRRRAWRRAIVASGVAAALAAGAVVLLEWRAEQRSLCKDGAAKLAGVWDDERKQTIARAFAASGLRYADASWRRVERLLDIKTTAWVEAREQACVATRVHGVQSEELLDQRMRCYGRRLSAMRALSDILAGADPVVVETALDAVYELPSLDACADVEGLGAAFELPADPRTRVELEDISEALERARALAHTARYGEALTLGEDLAARARALGHPPLTAEVVIEFARFQALLGHYEAAERLYHEAVALSSEAKNDAALVRAWTLLTGLVGDSLGRPTEGLIYAEVARAAALRAGNTPEQELRVATATGNLEFTIGRFEDAVSHYRRALELNLVLDSEDSPETAGSLNNLANALDELGAHEEAIEHYRRALSIFERALGEDHPSVALNLTNLGSALEQIGAWDEALALYERALAINTDAFGAGHAATANPECLIGNALLGLERDAQARARFERALEIWTESRGPDHPVNGYALVGLGRVDRRAGQLDDALRRFERALALREKGFGDAHPGVAEALAEIAEVHAARGEWRAARRLLARALKIAEGALASGHHKLARLRFAYARALWETATSDPARGDEEDLEASETPSRQRARARELARAARGVLAAAPGDRAEELAAIDTWLEGHVQ